LAFGKRIFEERTYLSMTLYSKSGEIFLPLLAEERIKWWCSTNIGDDLIE